MPKQDQLEIIGPEGQIEFHFLDPGRGVTNIGSHPDNDVILDSPGVAPFQAVLDHQQKPYRIMILSEEGVARLDGERLDPNTFQELHDWDTVEMDGYAIVLMEGLEAPGEPALPVQESLPPAGETDVPIVEAGLVAAAVVPGVFTALASLPPDEVDEVIVTELSEREWTVDVEQMATCQLTIANGGSIVATFDVEVEGLDPTWVNVTPPSVNLYEGARATINISILPLRQPASTAGPHHLAIVVTSPNHPNRASRLGATLMVNPYYEFSVGELSPKQQNVSWRKRTGEVNLPITNKGNSEAAFRLEGDDDERACRFEFEVPGEEVMLARQAEMRLNPDETRIIPVAITPVRRRLVGLRRRSYSFTITTILIEAAQTPRGVMGQLKASPLIGPILLLLILLLLASLNVFFLRPVAQPALGIASGSGDAAGARLQPDPQGRSLPWGRTSSSSSIIWTSGTQKSSLPSAARVQALQDETDTALPGEPITLNYNASRFSGLSPANILNRLNAIFLEMRLDYRTTTGEWQVVKTPPDFETSAGSITDVPPENGWYRLRADTWLSKLFPILSGASKEVPARVTPVEPRIVDFRAEPAQPLVGGEVTLSWHVADAETLILSYDGIEETLLDSELERGARSLTLEKDTTFTLIASNRFRPEGVQKPLTVRVLIPTKTPMPTPVIVRFDVNPFEITEGETVRLSWQVLGADTVAIDPLGADFLLQGDVGHQPTTLTNYKLTAIKTAPDGTQVKNSASKEVIVNPPPTATPEPKTPEIQVFEATPKEVVAGDDTSVTLTWSVSGATTNVEITAPNLTLSGLKNSDVMTITVKESTVFVLTAYNGELSRSAAAQVEVLEPTPTPTPEPSPTPLPGAPVVENLWATGDPADNIFGTGPTYQMYAGTRITLNWRVVGDEVEMFLSGTGLNRTPVFGEDWYVGPIAVDSTYQLEATNPGGTDAKQVQFLVLGTEPPVPPENFQWDGASRNFSWTYPEPAKIIGFRLYRTPPKEIRADLGALPAPGDPQPYSWNLGSECGYTYYIVAVYEDPPTSGTYLETDASQESWGYRVPRSC